MVEFKSVYPLMSKKFDSGFKCGESVPSVEDALNKLICKVNELGKNNANVINDWNNVMKWFLEQDFDGNGEPNKYGTGSRILFDDSVPKDYTFSDIGSVMDKLCNFEDFDNENKIEFQVKMFVTTGETSPTVNAKLGFRIKGVNVFCDINSLAQGYFYEIVVNFYKNENGYYATVNSSALNTINNPMYENFFIIKESDFVPSENNISTVLASINEGATLKVLKTELSFG